MPASFHVADGRGTEEQARDETERFLRGVTRPGLGLSEDTTGLGKRQVEP